MEAIGVILLIGVAIIALILAVAVIIYGIIGAGLQFAWASEFGFVGVVAFLLLGYLCFQLWQSGQFCGVGRPLELWNKNDGSNDLQKQISN